MDHAPDITFEDLRVEGPTFAITLEYIGEGNDGDYQPDDPSDEPLLRFTTQRRVDGNWEDVEDASYCTSTPATISRDEAEVLARYLLNQLEVHGDSSSLRRLCERLSWTTLADAQQAA